MELIILFCSFFLLCFILVKLTKKKSKLPPGPNALPIIGNLHQLYGGLIHHKLRDLAKKYGPLMYLQLGQVSTIVITSPEVAREVFKTNDLIFSQRPSCFETFRVLTYNFTNIIFSPYGNYWRQLRKICMMELLSQKRVQSFRYIREQEVLNLIKSIFLHEGSIFNLSQKLFSLTNCITSRIAFGKRNKDEEKFERLAVETSKLVVGFSVADLYPSFKLLQVLSGMEHKVQKVHKQFDAILQNILNEHRLKEGEEKEDLVDVLLNIQKGGDFEVPLSDNNIKAVIFVS